MKKGLKEKTK